MAMEYKSARKTTIVLEQNYPLSERNVQEIRHAHCNIPSLPSTPTRQPNERASRNPRNENAPPLIMIPRRTPLHSPNVSVVCDDEHEHAILTRRDNKLPVKRCFSKELVELSRKQIIVTKTTKSSKTDISVLPPKRVRFDDFKYASDRSRSLQDYLPLPPSTSSRQRHETSMSLKRREELKRLNSQPTRFALPSSRDGSNPNPSRKMLQHCKNDVRNQSKKMSTTLMKQSNCQNTAHFLVSVPNFPMKEWKESNCDVEMLREIMFLSETKSFPVTLFPKEDGVLAKFTNSADAELIRRIGGPSNRVGQNRILLYDVLKSPITLPFKIISGMIRWIAGR